MERVLLILPSSTYRAADFLSAAQRLGVDVVIASDEPQALSDVRGDHFLEVDLEDAERAANDLATALSRNPVGAVVAVDDQGVTVAARTAELLGLSHNPLDAVAATRDKVSLRDRLATTAVRQPEYRVVAAGSDLSRRVVDAATEVGYPCVVKPPNLAASRGVIRVDDAAAAARAATVICGIVGGFSDRSPIPLLVERFVPGDEVAVEGLLDNGELTVLALFDKPDPLDGPYFEETIYVTPSRHPESIRAAITDIVASAARTLGLTEGPVHAEVRLTPAGAGVEPVLIEIAARTIGGRCSKVLTFAAGRSLEELVLARALGHPALPVARPTTPGITNDGAARAAGVMMLPIPASGTLRGIAGEDAALATPGITGLEIALPIGKAIQQLPEGGRYLGFLFARASTPDAVEEALRRAHRHLRVDIEPLADAVRPA